MNMELKIKSMSLTAEARIIRYKERALIGKLRINRYRYPGEPTEKAAGQIEQAMEQHSALRKHRLIDVRSEARATHLTRMFLNGVPYRLAESTNCDPLPAFVIGRMVAMSLKYGVGVLPRRAQGDNRAEHDRVIALLNAWHEAKPTEEVLAKMKEGERKTAEYKTKRRAQSAAYGKYVKDALVATGTKEEISNSVGKEFPANEQAHEAAQEAQGQPASQA